MSETDVYILQAIRTHVWSGFYSPEDVQEMISDLLEEDADEAFLRAEVEPEFSRKANEEATWPRQTDCDRLNVVFAELSVRGIIALQNAGYTMSDGHSDVAEELCRRGKKGVRGYCFYHGQDLEGAVAGRGLMLAFGDLGDDQQKKVKVGCLVKDLLEEFGFTVQWNGDPKTRISLPGIVWKRRYTD